MIPELANPEEFRFLSTQIDTELGEGVSRVFFGGKTLLVMRNDSKIAFYLIPQSWLQHIREMPSGVTYHALGLQLGNLTEGKFKLSLAALEKLADLTRNIIKLSAHGATLFTYGRSILKESVVEINSNLERGSKVIVLDENSECLGLAELSVNALKVDKLRQEKLVAKNISDIGWYIRQKT